MSVTALINRCVAIGREVDRNDSAASMGRFRFSRGTYAEWIRRTRSAAPNCGSAVPQEKDEEHLRETKETLTNAKKTLRKTKKHQEISAQGVPEGLWGALGAPSGVPGGPRGSPETPWGLLGGSLGVPGGPLESPGGVLGAPWVTLGPPRGVPGASVGAP